MAEVSPWFIGCYALANLRALSLKPVYKKTDGDDYIYYTSKLFSIRVIIGSVVFLIVGRGLWEVYQGGSNEYIYNEKRGLQIIPRYGWETYVGDGEWQKDDTLKIIYN